MRSLCYREKIKTEFGSFFLQLDALPDGRAVGFTIAQPQKLEDTQVGNLLLAMQRAMQSLIDEAVGAQTCGLSASSLASAVLSTDNPQADNRCAP